MCRTGLLSWAAFLISTGMMLGQTTTAPEPIGPPRDKPAAPADAPVAPVPPSTAPAPPAGGSPAPKPGDKPADKAPCEACCPEPCPPPQVPFFGCGHEKCCPGISCVSAEVEYLLWQLKGSPVRFPLLTAGSPEDPIPGAIGQDHTQILFGAKDYNDDWQFSGVRGRASVGIMEGILSAEVGGFWLQKWTAAWDQFGNLADQVIARPFFNPSSGNTAVKLLSFTDAFTDGVRVGLATQLWGAEGNVMFNIPYLGAVDSVFAGGRYLNLQETLNVTDQVTTGFRGESFFNGQLQNVGDRVLTSDHFRTTNKFYGAQVGFIRYFDIEGPLSVRVRGSLAGGNTQETLTVLGNSTYYNNVQNTVSSLPGGFLAQPTNSGTFTHNRFALVPEVGITAGWRFTDQIVLSVGYNFLYWSSVARPGDQVNLRIDPANIPVSPSYNPAQNAPDPVRLFHTTAFWAQGLTVGVSWTF
jgi:hypothetical protein